MKEAEEVKAKLTRNQKKMVLSWTVVSSDENISKYFRPDLECLIREISSSHLRNVIPVMLFLQNTITWAVLK